MIDFSIIHTADGDEHFSVEVHCWDTWLDGSTYHRRDRMIAWLEDNSIEFEQGQHIRQFIWRFTSLEDATLFVLKWA